ncbi:MAG: glycosyl hydrolase [Alphaproteobacteria bacterium]|nr:glycosyl hydrolase [Alphaproteobacteria bacterium]
MRNLLLVMAMSGCASEDYVRLYHTEDKAPSLDWDAIGALDHQGARLYDKGVNFNVFSANATKVDLLLFDDPEADQPTQQFEMVRYGDVWNLYVEGVGPGQHYGYVAWGPNWPYVEEFYPGSLKGFSADVDVNGNRFNPNKLIVDPYARAVHRDHDWGRGSAASGPHREQLTYGAAAKSVVVDSKYEWRDQAWRDARMSGNHPGHGWQDLIVYEVHAKGLTANAASNQYGVEHPGTYRGIGEMAPYLADLGITAVELLPIHEKPLDGGYWGYNNLSWFAFEVSYASAFQEGREPSEVVDEVKWMVDELHAHDIEVIVDVVYNHTGEGGLWRTKLFFNDSDGDYLCDPGNAVNLDSSEVASLLSFRAIDSPSYYVLANAGQSYWSGSTGVGNQVRANHPPVRRQILDSLRYMAEEIHIDGFRFDLAGVLGEPDNAPSQYWSVPTDSTLNTIIDDPVLQSYNTRVIAEPWTTAYDGSTQYPSSSNDPNIAWSEWNANFRDWWRSYLNDDGFNLNSTQGLDGGAVMTGSYVRYSHNGRKPYHSVNFITAHDGFTMFDLFSYGEKENGCGPLNPICCYDACSAWCDPTSGDSNNHSRSWADEWTKRQMMRNAFVGLLVSHGTPMMLGGDEWMRTQYGNNNAYTTWSDNEWAWFRWGEWSSENRNNVFRHRMHDFVRDMIEFRKAHTYALSPTEYGQGMPFEWKTPANTPADDGTWNSKSIMVHYYDNGSFDQPELVILYNLSQSQVDFTLPGGRNWGVVVDTQTYFDLPGRNGEPDGFFSEFPDADPFQSNNIRLGNPTPVSGVYGVAPRSIVVLEQQP